MDIEVCACMVNFVDVSNNKLILEVEIQDTFGLVYFDWYGDATNRKLTIAIKRTGTVGGYSRNRTKGTKTYAKEFDIIVDGSISSYKVYVFHLYTQLLDSVEFQVGLLDDAHHRPFHNVIDPRR